MKYIVIKNHNPHGLVLWCRLATYECAPLKVLGSNPTDANF